MILKLKELKELKNLTVLILTYQTKKEIIFNCLKSINNKVKIVIVENSKKFLFETEIKKKFPNTKIFCTGKNLGYGAGNNFGIKLIETKYVFILNPDTICDNNLFDNIPKVINSAKNFTIIGCQYIDDKIYMPAGFFDTKKNHFFKKNFLEIRKIKPLTKVEWVTGCSMLLNLSKFKHKKIFDENIFLYFEELDLCKSIINKGEKIYTSSLLKIKHLGFKSSLGNNIKVKENTKKIREWHWMWSTFYFYKKNYSYLYAIYKIYGKFTKSIFKTIFFLLTFQKEKKDKYLHRFLGMFNAIIGRSASFRGKI